MNTENRFGIWLRAVRKGRGLTQADLAAKLDRSIDAISNIERGKSLPSFEMLEALSEALSVTPDEMFDFRGGSETVKKAKLLATLLGIARQMSEPDLAIAVDQLEVLSKRSAR